MEVAVDSHSQGNGVFSHGFGGVAGNPHDFDAKTGRGLQIHIIESGTAHQHQLHPPVCQNLQHLGSHIRADKGADGLRIGNISGGFGRELRFPVLQFQLGIVPPNLSKTLPIIGFCGKECDFHSGIPPCSLFVR